MKISGAFSFSQTVTFVQTIVNSNNKSNSILFGFTGWCLLVDSHAYAVNKHKTIFLRGVMLKTKEKEMVQKIYSVLGCSLLSGSGTAARTHHF